jgi:hypothetical protein
MILFMRFAHHMETIISRKYIQRPVDQRISLRKRYELKFELTKSEGIGSMNMILTT